MELSIINDQVIILPLRNKVHKPRRIIEIDFLRGLLIILMVLDHIAYDFGQLMPEIFKVEQGPLWLFDFSNWSFDYWLMGWRINLRYVVIILFFILVGVSSRFSRNGIKRGMLLVAYGCVVSIGAYYASIILNVNLFIFFGIISCLGVSLLSYSLLRLFFVKALGLRKSWKWVALLFAFVIIAYGIMMRIEIATRELTSQNWWALINGRYTPILQTYRYVSGHIKPIDYHWTTKIDIILGRYWYGVDWSGIFPFMGYAFLGGFIGEVLYDKKVSLLRHQESKATQAIEKVLRPIAFVGSKSIYVYLFHQIVLAAIVFVFMLLANVPLR
ncbi:MAG: DUF1624 domain-containing protein [Bacteroidia bacterium]|nr:DUF1624 domain-containing protein [Bacteroidia bacterium]